MLKTQEAMRRLFDRLNDRAGDMSPLPGIYPDTARRSFATAATAASSAWRAGACQRRRNT